MALLPFSSAPLATPVSTSNGGTGTSTTFTAGSVVFAGPSGVYSQDNANFFWDDTNNRLALALPGTPETAIHTGGAVTANAFYINDNFVGFEERTTNSLDVITGQVVRMTVDSDGQVGINDTTPNSQLHVQIREATAKGLILQGFASQSGNYMEILNSAGTQLMLLDSTPNLRYSANGNMIFSNSGRGIFFVANPLTDAVGSQYLSGRSDGGLELGTNGGKIYAVMNHATDPCMDFRLFNQSANIIEWLRATALVSGTPGAGFGSRIRFEASSTTTNYREQAFIDGIWATATDASRKAALKFTVYDTAAREALRLEASGSAPMIGFLGATPVVRSSAFTPTNVTTDRSYDANATSVDELADVLGTLIADLQATGLIG